MNVARLFGPFMSKLAFCSETFKPVCLHNFVTNMKASALRKATFRREA